MKLTTGQVAAVGAALALAWGASRYLRTPFDAAFRRAARPERGITFNLLRAIAQTESGMRADVVSRPNSNGTRDYGLMQVNERTARTYGYAPADMLQVDKALAASTRLLTELRDELRPFTEARWIAAYNAGSPTINRAGIINPDYVLKVLWNRQLFAIGEA